MRTLCLNLLYCLCTALYAAPRPEYPGATPLGLRLEARSVVPVSGVVYFGPDLSVNGARNALDDVGLDVRCNQDATTRRQNETTIHASILNTDIALSGSNDYRNGDASGGFYRTLDGGVSWQDALVSRGPAGVFDAAGDPVAVVDAAGRMYAAYIAFDRDTTEDNGLWVQTSVDNGATWSEPSGVVTHIGQLNVDFEDKPYACADLSASSPYQNNYYITWTKFGNFGGAAINVSRSTDGGATFSAPLQISSSSDCQFSCPAVGPNGEVYAVWFDYSSSQIKFDRSFNGGVTWGADIAVAPFNEVWGAPNPCGTFRTPSYPVISVDNSNSPRRGWIYVSWGEHDFAGNDADVMFVRSTDGGSTWSAPLRVHSDPGNKWQWWHWMSVNPWSGDIGIPFLDRRDDPAGCFYREYATISTNGGTSWVPEFQVSTGTSNPTSSTFLGDYCGASFKRDGFYACWVDRRDTTDAGNAWAAWFRLAPLAPTLVALESGGGIRLNWTSSPNVAAYEVRSSLSATGPFTTIETSTSDTTWVDASAFLGSKYYQVFAIVP